MPLEGTSTQDQVNSVRCRALMGLPLEMSVCPVHTHAHVCELHVCTGKRKGVRWVAVAISREEDWLWGFNVMCFS